MKIAIAGGSGFVGTALVDHLVNHGHQVIVLSRKASSIQPNGVKTVEWLHSNSKPELELEGVSAIVNLAGESLNSGRWTKDRKRAIVASRIQATKEMNRIISQLSTKPTVLVNASAIGYYGTSLHDTFTESGTAGNDFLAQTVTAWESEASRTNMHGVRTVLARFGVILGTNGGALPKLLLPYKLFGGGNLGSGKQWMSWIHLSDVVHAIDFCLQQPGLAGPVNFTAPHPKTMNDFGEKLGEVLRKPHWTTIPAFPIKMVLGEMSILILEGQRVFPTKLLEANYRFQFPELESALSNLVRKKRPE